MKNEEVKIMDEEGRYSLCWQSIVIYPNLIKNLSLPYSNLSQKSKNQSISTQKHTFIPTSPTPEFIPNPQELRSHI
jgi:hypothetical protein